MKKAILIFVFCNSIFLSKIFAQCNQTTALDSLDANNVNALIMNGGDMWWNQKSGMAHYKVPKSGNVSSLFVGAIWMGGFDAAGQLHVAAQTYRQGGANDYFSGLLDTSGSVTAATCNLYDKIWKVKASDINAHNINSTHTLVNTPASILEWPAIGNPYALGKSNSSLNITQPLAPFIDVNGDGIYNPLSGDYPNICGDQALWYVINDNGNIHSNSSCSALGVEIQVMAYSIASTDININNTTFYKYVITNKSKNNYDSFVVSLWNDADLGCGTTDYFGCDSARQMLIIYNSTAIDNPCPVGYGSTVPIQGISLLSAKNHTQNLNYNLSGIYVQNNSVNLITNRCNQYYKLMTGFINDSMHLTYGGNGIGGTTKSNFMFPDSPEKIGTNPQNGLPYWSMCSQTSTTYDIKNIISTQIPHLSINDVVELNFASITHWGNVYPCPSFSGIAAAHDIVDTFFMNLNCGKLNATAISKVNRLDNSVQLFPNPASENIIISSLQNLSSADIVDVTGRSYKQVKLSNSESKNEINISELPMGIYFVKINHLNGRTTNLKFVKN